MLKKTLIVVGALVAATVAMPDAAAAGPHRTFHAHAFGHSLRMPRRASRRFGFARAAWRPVAAAHRLHAARSAPIVPHVVAYAPRRAYAARRAATRPRAATAYQAVPFAGLVPAALAAPFAAPSLVATPAPATAGGIGASPAPVVAERRGAGRHRLAMRRRAALAYNAVPPAAMRRAGGAQTGQASFYGGGGRTAAGGHVGAGTCAHRSLPFGTRVLVTNLANARSTVLTVNDRGPFVRGRIVDVSVGAAGVLGMLHSGTAPVRVQVVGGPG